MTIGIPLESAIPTFWEIFIGLFPLFLFVLLIEIYIWWMDKDATKFLEKCKKRGEKELVDNSKTNEEFEKVLSFGEKEITDLIANLPEDAKKLAEQTPSIFEPTIMVNEKNNLILGMYVSFFNSIVIYLGSIMEFSKQTNQDIGWLIRKTYLHELAHRFGLKEFEMEERGLDGSQFL